MISYIDDVCELAYSRKHRKWKVPHAEKKEKKKDSRRDKNVCCFVFATCLHDYDDDDS